MLTTQYAKALPGIRVNAADPGYTATDLNGNRGTQTVAEGTDAIVALATEGPGAGSGRFVDRGGDIGNFDFRDLTMEDVGTPILITEYYPKIPDHDSTQAVGRLTPHFHDISITNLTATGAKTAGFVVGLPESPIPSVTLTNVQISAEKGMTISNATVIKQAFEVKAASGPPLIMMENAKMQDK